MSLTEAEQTEQLEYIIKLVENFVCRSFDDNINTLRETILRICIDELSDDSGYIGNAPFPHPICPSCGRCTNYILSEEVEE
tara:strand:- start:506 stop:748 length:243 start_codon:yes stop_codon:yes gene_type:complete